MFQNKPLGSLISSHVGGGTPSRQVADFWNGNIPWASVKDFSDNHGKLERTEEHITAQGLNSSSSSLIKENTIVICSRMAVGKAALTKIPVAINQDLKALFNKKNVNERYLLKLLQWLAVKIESKAVGSTVKGIRISDLLALETPVAPETEQPIIADVLDNLDTKIIQTELLIRKMQLVKEGLLHDLLTRGIGVNGQIRPSFKKAPELYKKTTIGFIPKEWEVAPLLSKISFPVGQVDPRESPYQDLILVAPDHIDKKTGRLLSKVTAKAQNAISGKYLFQPGDVIYSKIRPYLRKAVCVDFHGLCSADAYPLRPNNDVSPTFLLATILGQQFSTFAESVSMRSGFPKINRSEMSEFKAGWPTLAEQEKISCMIVNANDRILNEEKTLDSLRGIKSGLTHDLLTGRVRVTELLNNKPEVQ